MFIFNGQFKTAPGWCKMEAGAELRPRYRQYTGEALAGLRRLMLKLRLQAREEGSVF